MKKLKTLDRPDASFAASLCEAPQDDAAGLAHGVPEQPSRVTLRATADSRSQIRDANHSGVFTGVLKPGDVYRVPDLPDMPMRAGSAGGIDIIADRRPALALGLIGAVQCIALIPSPERAERG